jgi:hypothetical protein
MNVDGAARRALREGRQPGERNERETKRDPIETMHAAISSGAAKGNGGAMGGRIAK